MMAKKKDTTPKGGKCPLSIWLEKTLPKQVARIDDEYASSDVVCNYICPVVIGKQEYLPDGRCAIHARLVMLMH
jgi:hypothetical protein